MIAFGRGDSDDEGEISVADDADRLFRENEIYLHRRYDNFAVSYDDDGRPQAALAWFVDPGDAELEFSIVVDKEHRGKGLASRLLNIAEDEASSDVWGVDVKTISADVVNPIMGDMLSRRGYSRSGRVYSKEVGQASPRKNPGAPPWAKKAVARLREKHVVGDEWLPLDDSDMLGCGRYGCVYALPDSKTVLKVSSDPTEVHFIKRAMEIGDWPEGIVEYRALTELDFTYRRRRVYAIWREAAVKVGLPRDIFWGFQKDYDKRMLNQFATRLEQFRRAAARFRERLKRAEDRGKRKRFLSRVRALEDWAFGLVTSPRYEVPSWVRGPEAAVLELRVCEVVSEFMENEPFAYYVGGAFRFYLEHGLLLADVHGQNVGIVDRSEDPDFDPKAYVITDPGHAIDLVG